MGLHLAHRNHGEAASSEPAQTRGRCIDQAWQVERPLWWSSFLGLLPTVVFQLTSPCKWLLVFTMSPKADKQHGFLETGQGWGSYLAD